MNIGILLFNEVEVLDFAGPFEVLSLAEKDKKKLFKVKTIAQTKDPIQARNGLTIIPDFSFDDRPQFDIVIIPGGYGAEEIEINNATTIEWIKTRYDQVQIMASICTGALLLAKAGLLSGRKATTHWMDTERLQTEFPDVKVHTGVKFVDEGKIITSGGISAGINMSFHLIERLYGADISQHTAKRMEYDLMP
ncbi:ThiJ/PfpI family protein [Fulvivirga imtechensis AK7]|uniref:ThiJ/PfpI family protein n=1 Tax=Fulvivirga imtechensis AK7 TaxID=1237149 RepID=L8JNG1_9BACT|nr:DJ-1/PfpI family protein [Fulvivirga imtechensis]ELR70491.1 ThiJ/PfpI family protein [Fulvivirga imtechensis AK7]